VSVISATWEAKIRRIMACAKSETSSSTNNPGMVIQLCDPSEAEV
jgi:hypothetical protein